MHHGSEQEATTVFAVDKSGSTAGAVRYWNRVQQELNTLLPQHSGRRSVDSTAASLILLLWDTEAFQVDLKSLQGHVRTRYGYGSTRLQSVCQFLNRNVFHGLPHSQQHPRVKLYVFTDGQVARRDVAACDALLSGFVFDSVRVIIEETDSHVAFDVSVAAPFLRKSNYTVEVNGSQLLRGDTRSQLKLPTVSTMEEFEAVRDDIWKLVYPRFGFNAYADAGERTVLHEWLVETRRKILIQMSAEATRKTPELNKTLKMLMEGRENEVIAMLKRKESIGDPTPGDIVEAAFAPLISISDISDFSAQGYRSFPSLDRLGRKPTAAAITDQEIWGDFENAEDLASVCSITGDMDTPVLLFRVPKDGKSLDGIFSRLSSKTVNYIMTQPLNTLRCEDAVESLVSMIDHPMGHKSYLQWVHQTRHNTSPFTRAELMGCLPISSHTQAVVYGNKFICHVLWGGKMVGIPVMWLWVIYFLLRNHPKLEYVRSTYHDFMDSFKAVLVKRTNTELTRLGMSGLGNFPMEMVPVSVACWYSVRGSSVMYADRLLSRDQERLLQFRSIAKETAEIALICGIQIDISSVMDRVNLLRLIEALFNLGRTDGIYAEKLMRTLGYDRFEFGYDEQKVFSLTEDEQRFVLWDRRRSDASGDHSGDLKIPEVLRKFTLHECLQIYVTLVKPYVISTPGYWPVAKYSRIPIPMKDYMPEERSIDVLVNGNSYGYKVNEDRSYFFADSPICPGTMRCYFTDRATGKNWREAAEASMGPLDNQVSAYKYYWKTCAKIYKKLAMQEKETGVNMEQQPIGFPTVKEVLLIIERGQKLKGFHVLPADFHIVVQSILEDYEVARKEYQCITGALVTPKLFRELLSKSQDYQARQEMELQWTDLVANRALV